MLYCNKYFLIVIKPSHHKYFHYPINPFEAGPRFFRKYKNVSSENTRAPSKTNHYEIDLLQRKNENRVLPQKPRSDW